MNFQHFDTFQSFALTSHSPGYLLYVLLLFIVRQSSLRGITFNNRTNILWLTFRCDEPGWCRRVQGVEQTPSEPGDTVQVQTRWDDGFRVKTETWSLSGPGLTGWHDASVAHFAPCFHVSSLSEAEWTCRPALTGRSRKIKVRKMSTIKTCLSDACLGTVPPGVCCQSLVSIVAAFSHETSSEGGTCRLCGSEKDVSAAFCCDWTEKGNWFRSQHFVSSLRRSGAEGSQSSAQPGNTSSVNKAIRNTVPLWNNLNKTVCLWWC